MVKCKNCENEIKEKDRPTVCVNCGHIMHPQIQKNKKKKEAEFIENEDGKILEKLED